MVKKYLIGFVIWSCLLQLTSAEPETAPSRPTNLEDIERDNLKNERHSAFKKEAYHPSQSAQAASSHGANHYSVQIEHHPGGATSHAGINYLLPPSAPAPVPVQAPTHPGLNYVTPIPSGPSITYSKEYTPQYQTQYQTQPQYQTQQKVPQVHEEHSTYTVPSRQSLIQPIIGGSAPAQTFLTPQPQYVYVQAQAQVQQPPPQQHQQQQQQQSQYANQPNLPQSLLHILPHHQGAYIMIPPTTSFYQQQPHSAQQYAAYVNDPDNQVQTYSHGESGQHSPQPVTSSPPAPTPAPLQKAPGVIYASPSSTPAPHRHQSPSSEFSIVKSVETPVYYSPDNHLNSPPTIHFTHSPAKQAIQIHHETQTHYPSLTHPNNGILNYFGLQHKQPTSLLDSYVPSSLQLSPVKQFPYPSKPAPIYRPSLQHFHHHHAPTHQQLFYQPTYPVSHSAYPLYPSHTPSLQPQQIPSASAPAYNTIAYSVPLSQTKTVTQYKRSPALETVAGVRYSHPRAVSAAASSKSGAITTKLQPAAKF
ncbi:extensin-1 isoform X2 [Aedes aegypti]|uniref:Uncharacterized protein n=1 Tax=Aedes aegypti TaxID=7159 RepID=A0A903TK06_AEDAE|nr:extensin-1 isoform X2 [Aedes aegypti]